MLDKEIANLHSREKIKQDDLESLNKKLTDFQDTLKDYNHRRQDAQSRIEKLKVENDNLDSILARSKQKFD